MPDVDDKTEVTETQTPEPAPDTTQESVEAPDTRTPEEISEDQRAQAKVLAKSAEYEPNFKFKVHGEEREFDDWAKGLVKDKESEERFRDIMTKVHGIEHIKQDRETLRTKTQELESVRQRYETQNQNLDILNEFVRSGNYDAFFQTLKIPEQAVMQWAARRVQYMEMDPMQRAEYDRAVAAQRDSVLHSRNNQTLSQQMEQLKHQQRMLELDTYLSRPELMQAVQDYDQRRGQAGAFRQVVQHVGMNHHLTEGKDIPVEQAVQEACQMLGLTPGSATAVPSPGVGTVPPVVAPGKKPVIPSTSGNGLSATRSVPKSLEDIRKIREARFGG
jgi:hypothetical protein